MSQVLVIPNELKFPQNKEQAGAAWWGVIHNIAAKYSDNPSEQERNQIKRFYHYLINNFVCIDCVNDAKNYMKHNTPDYSNRTSLSKYFCDMHNYVNEKLSKPTLDCSNILSVNSVHDSSTCTTCTLSKKSSIKDNLEDYKTTVRNIILSLCKEENIAPPNIHFQPCPDNTSTSCITYDSGRMKDGVLFADADIYINPYSASLRTIKHETAHYIDLKKGNNLTEIGADNYAIDKINTHFNFDSYKNELVSNNKLMDEVTSSQLLPIKNDVFTTNTVERKVTYDNLNLKTYHDYPSLNRINNLFEKPAAYNAKESVNAAEPEVHKNVFVPDNNDDFILSGLNGVFAWPASLVGVSPSSMSMTYVGSLVTNVLMYLVTSNFSTFGASLVGLLSSVSLFSGAAIFKNSIGSGDRGFIQGIVSMMLMHSINSLVPKKRVVMAEGLRLFIEGVKSFDVAKIKEALFFDDSVFEINQSIAASNKPNPSKGLNMNDPKVANALMGLDLGKPTMNIGDTRMNQLTSQRQYDSKNFNPLTNVTGSEKNTIPNYSNSDLKSVANSYARKRMMSMSGGVDNLTGGLDVDELTNELNAGIAEMDLDSGNYEVLQM